MNTVWNDIRYAIRGFRRTPLFTAVAILSLAFGIGANTAIFSLLDQVLLRLLPVKDPQQLVFVDHARQSLPQQLGRQRDLLPDVQRFQQP